MGSGIAFSLSAAAAMMFMTACEPITTSGSAPDSSRKADWNAIYQRQKPRLADGWGTPVELPVSRRAWTESLDVSADGQELRFFYWPGPDLFGAVMRGDEISEDGDIWISAAPFTEMSPISGYPHLTEDLFTSSGIMISADGVSFAASNRRGQVTGDYDRENIYRNGEMLAFNTTEANPGNPHYCKARDELWLDGNADDWIGVIPNAARSGFKNRPLRVVPPINGRGTSMQPWLDASCSVLLFASNRARVGAELDGPWIYMSRRLGDGLERWSEPVPIISGENVIAVGDPTVARLPDGRARLFFVQYLMDAGSIDPRSGIGPMRTALFYVDEQAPELLK